MMIVVAVVMIMTAAWCFYTTFGKIKA